MLVDSENLFYMVLSNISECKLLSVDTETSGLDPYKSGHRLCGVSIYDGNESYYFPFRHVSDNLDISKLYELFDVIKKGNKKILFYNSKFDLKMLLFEGIDLRSLKFGDVMLLMHLYDEEVRKPSLKNLGAKHIDPEIKAKHEEFKKLLKKKKIESYDKLYPYEISDYACRDAEITFLLFEFVKNKVDSSKYIIQLEHDLIRRLIDIENYGIKIDVEYVNKCKEVESEKIAELKKNIYEQVGYEFSILSNVQLTNALNSINIFSPMKSEKTKKDLWPDDVFKTISHPIAKQISEYRSREKIVSNYLNSYLELSDSSNVIHANFNPIGARTGRFSITSPPLQTVPRYSIVVDEADVIGINAGSLHRDHLIAISQDLIGAQSSETVLRKCIIPRESFFLLGVDYSQMEQLVFAEIANEHKMIDLSNEGVDLHTYVARMILGYDDAKSDLERILKRQIAKYINFGIMYGMGYKTLSKLAQISEKESSKFLEDYFALFKDIKKFQNDIQNKIRKSGVCETSFGRVRHLPSEFAYKGINAVIQGTCADIVKITMIKISDFLSSYRSKLLLQIHDELLFEIHEDERDIVPEIFKIMTDFSFKIQLKVDAKYSYKNWSEGEEWIVS